MCAGVEPSAGTLATYQWLPSQREMTPPPASCHQPPLMTLKGGCVPVGPSLVPAGILRSAVFFSALAPAI